MSRDEVLRSTQRALDLEEVPPGKWVLMVQRTLIGGTLAALAVAGAALWEWPWWVVVPAVLVGATVWSTQIVTHALKALVGPLRDLMKIIRNGNVP